MERKTLMELFNKKPRNGSLCTGDGKGEISAAISGFGSPRMIDENTMLMGVGKNRSFRFLQENPNAVFIFMESREMPEDWNGAMVYLHAEEIMTEGELYQKIKKNDAKTAGKKAAEMIHAAIRFTITEVQPLMAIGRMIVRSAIRAVSQPAVEMIRT